MSFSYRKTIAVLAILFTPVWLQAQFVEIGLLGGCSNYLGDLSNEKFVIKETHLAGGLFGRYNINNKWAVKGFAGYGRVSGDDKNNYSQASDNNYFFYYRNLNFYTDIYEFSLQLEYNLLPNDLRSSSSRPFVPYVFGGIGVFHFNPKTVIKAHNAYLASQGQDLQNDLTIELQPLSTEGQGTTNYNDVKPYSLTDVCFPIGIGFRQRLGTSFTIGLEAGLRYTLTNYIDDVGGKYADASAVRAFKGDFAGYLADRSVDKTTDGKNYFSDGQLRSSRKMFTTDLYFIAGVTVSYIIRSKGMECPRF